MNAKKEMDGVLKAVPLGKIRAHPQNPRRTFDGAALDQLAESLKKVGQLQPGVARPHPAEAGMYQLLCGHRRFVALGKAELAEMLLIVREVDDLGAMKILVTENLHREDLTPMEEANGVKLLLGAGKDHKAIAEDLGKSLSWVYKRERLTQLHPNLVAGVEDPEHLLSRAATEYLEEIAVFPLAVQEVWVRRGPWNYGQDGLSITRLRSWIAGETRLLQKAGWDLDDAGLVPAAGSCRNCPKRSGCAPALFGMEAVAEEEITKQDRCLDEKCWKGKAEAHGARAVKAAQAVNPRILRVAAKDAHLYPLPKGVVESYDYEIVKKNKPRAEEAVIINGGEAGKVVWILLDRGDKENPLPVKKSAAQMADATPKEKAAELEEKRKELGHRRVAKALGLLQADLADAKTQGKIANHLGLAELAPLIVMFGTQDEDSRADFSGKELAPRFKQLDGDCVGTLLRVTSMVLPRMAAHLEVFRTTEDNARQVRYAEFFCSILKADWPEYLAKAEAELPEPKSWRALESPQEYARRLTGYADASAKREAAQFEEREERQRKERAGEKADVPAKAGKKSPGAVLKQGLAEEDANGEMHEARMAVLAGKPGAAERMNDLTGKRGRKAEVLSVKEVTGDPLQDSLIALQTAAAGKKAKGGKAMRVYTQAELDKVAGEAVPAGGSPTKKTPAVKPPLVKRTAKKVMGKKGGAK